MNVDKVAARQGIADKKTQADPVLCNKVCKLMGQLSKPGAIKRAEFDLNAFLVELAKIDFDKYDRADVAKILQQTGESLATGLWVADHGFTEAK